VNDEELENLIESEAPLEKDFYEIGKKIFPMSVNEFYHAFFDK
jgi:hypothetical protein